MNKPYVTHTCKREGCGEAFMSVDRNNAAKYPPANQYCPKCVALGYKYKPNAARVSRGKALAELARNARKSLTVEDLALDDMLLDV